jgi:hypothetical protein
MLPDRTSGARGTVCRVSGADAVLVFLRIVVDSTASA